MKRVTILGAGVMGSAMALPLVDRGHDVRLVGTHLDGTIINRLAEDGFHPKLKATLPGSITVFDHHQLADAVGPQCDLIVLGVSSAGVNWAVGQLASVVSTPVPVLMITKGMAPAPASLTTLPDLVQGALHQRLGFHVPVAAVGGPCIAGELAVRRPTATVVASRDLGLAAALCAALETDYYHPRPSIDLVGVEVCAAFKNFFAIAVGWAQGQMDFLAATENAARNNNAAALLFGQAIREMMVLCRALGGSAESVWGLPGAGDLYVTSQAGRNSRLGQCLGRGLTHAEAKAGPLKGETIEGAELGLAVASSLRAMMAAGTLPSAELPVLLALLDALENDQPLNVPWAQLGR